MVKRAKARYADKRKAADGRLQIDREAFIAWYCAQPDACAYCGLTFDELRELRIRRGGGYCVSWDIDRKNSQLPYEPENLALSCFVCNMAKADVLSQEETRTIGHAVRRVWNERLRVRRGA
jgi:5-methylcytosine-specific restriction endonuclease McrA